MSLSDRARQLAAKAQAYAAVNKDKIIGGVQQAERAADARTGGRYHDQIAQAGQRAEQAIASLPEQGSPPAPPTSTPEAPPDGSHV